MIDVTLPSWSRGLPGRAFELISAWVGAPQRRHAAGTQTRVCGWMGLGDVSSLPPGSREACGAPWHLCGPGGCLCRARGFSDQADASLTNGGAVGRVVGEGAPRNRPSSAARFSHTDWGSAGTSATLSSRLPVHRLHVCPRPPPCVVRHTSSSEQLL